MQNSKNLKFFIVFLLAGFILTTGCKKESNDPVTPEFKITSAFGKFPDGSLGMQFFATSTNIGVTMTNVSVSDPVSFVRTFDLKGEQYVKNLKVRLQEDQVGYVHKIGTWKFKLVGKVTENGSPFEIDATLDVVN